MSAVKKVSGLTTAIAAAAMFTAAPVVMTTASAAENVHCYGVNVCKGHNACKTANNACKGQGSCKGQGFVSVSKQACDDIGGEVGA